MANEPAFNSPEWWEEIGFYYEPIPFYDGRILKHQGIATKGNQSWMMARPGMIILDAYKGDRIRADDHTLFPS